MKKTIFLLSLLLVSFLSFTQEIEEREGTSIPAEQNAIEEENSVFEEVGFLMSNQYYGPFDVNRYKLDINLIDISYTKDKAPMMDILSIAQAEERRKRSYIRELKAPGRQLSQIRSQFQISVNNSENLYIHQNYDQNRRVRNDALLENRQPFSPFTPYYGRYGQPYYLDTYYGTPSYRYYRR